MNMANCVAEGAGIFVAGYSKRFADLGGVFAGVGAIVVIAGVLLLVGYFCFLGRDLSNAVRKGNGIGSV
jgi:hypothetical protein